MRGDRPHESLIRTVVSWGRLTGIALGAVTITLIGLLLVNGVIFQVRLDEAWMSTRLLRESHQAMLEQQSGLRGFLYSGDERYLEAYQRGSDALAVVNPEAARLISGQGRVGELYLEFRLAQSAWVDGWAGQAIDTARDQLGEVPTAFQEQDKFLFDTYRTSYDETIAELLSRRDDAYRDQRNALVGAIVGSIAVTVGAGAIASRRTRALRRAVGEPLSALLGRLEQIGIGDLTPQEIASGPAEFERLAKGLEDTAAVLAAARADGERRAGELQTRSRRQGEVLRLAREVSGSLSLRYVLRGVCTHAAAVADDARVLVWLLDEGGTLLHPFADSAGPDLQPIGLEPRELGDDAVGRAGRLGVMLGHDDDDRDNVLAIPMVVGARVIGVLEFLGPQVGEFSSDALEVLETLAVHAASAIGVARLHELTEGMAMTDVLTGLPNRRSFDRDLDVECAATARYGRPLALLMIDVDNFKMYNDSFGHSAGDRALQRVGQVLTSELRSTDKAYRYGGEELAIVLRETTPEAAHAMAERIRQAVEHHFAGADEPRQVTISIGVAGPSDHDRTPKSLVIAADAALYDAKKAGRNRVCIAGSVSDPRSSSNSNVLSTCDPSPWHALSHRGEVGV